MRAYCFASGQIEFGRVIPEGALPIARGREKPLKDFIEGQARHGYSTRLVKGRPTRIPGTETLLVPGLPEAPDQRAGLDALHAWLDWIVDKAPYGVVVFWERRHIKLTRAQQDWVNRAHRNRGLIDWGVKSNSGGAIARMVKKLQKQGLVQGPPYTLTDFGSKHATGGAQQ